MQKKAVRAVPSRRIRSRDFGGVHPRRGPGVWAWSNSIWSQSPEDSSHGLFRWRRVGFYAGVVSHVLNLPAGLSIEGQTEIGRSGRKKVAAGANAVGRMLNSFVNERLN
jgi:hypothetical protein